MKRLYMMMLAASLSVGMLAGCGKKSDDVQKEETVATEKEETAADNDSESDTGEYENMTREEVMEKYYKPMEQLLSEYNATTKPSEIESIAQEYNKLAVEGRTAYINATGTAPKSEFIPRREYIAKEAFYSVAKDRLSDYDEMYISYSIDEGEDDNGEPAPTNIISRSDDEIASITPEASDSVLYLVKREDSAVTDFLLIKDGGKDTLEVNVSDYTDSKIIDVLVFGDYIVFDKPESYTAYIIYKYTSNSLELIEEYYDYDAFHGYPDFWYQNDKLEDLYHNASEDAFIRAEEKLHLRLDD